MAQEILSSEYDSNLLNISTKNILPPKVFLLFWHMMETYHEYILLRNILPFRYWCNS